MMSVFRVIISTALVYFLFCFRTRSACWATFLPRPSYLTGCIILNIGWPSMFSSGKYTK